MRNCDSPKIFLLFQNFQIFGYKVMLFVKRDTFTSSFPIWMPFISFSCPINWSESPRQILNEKSRQPCLLLDLRGKAFFIIKNDISCCLWMVFIMLKFPSISSLLSVFIMKEFYFYYIKKCRCSSLPLFSLFPFFSLVCSPFFDFFPEPSRTSGKKKAWAAVHLLPEVPCEQYPPPPPPVCTPGLVAAALAQAASLHFDLLSDPLSPGSGPLSSCHSSSVFRFSCYLFPGVLDCFGSYWYLESQRLFSRL